MTHQPITDAVYGKRAPSRKPSEGSVRRPAGSLVGDLIPRATRQKLQGLLGRLEKAEAERKRGRQS